MTEWFLSSWSFPKVKSSWLLKSVNQPCGSQPPIVTQWPLNPLTRYEQYTWAKKRIANKISHQGIRNRWHVVAMPLIGANPLQASQLLGTSVLDYYPKGLAFLNEISGWYKSEYRTQTKHNNLQRFTTITFNIICCCFYLLYDQWYYYNDISV